ncbi:MAG: hemin ABC transporter substrate-binding protein, partial [Actinobacteria bacterium]|nr:hemin ABC transporter substrate-binding protein [Actinomycetota bacterium]
MKRLVSTVIAAVVVAAGCSSSDTTRETSGERIVTLTAGLTEAVFALGAGDLVVARDISSTIAEAEALPIVTTAHDINVEALLAVRPTLILIDEDTGPETALDQIAATGVRIELVDNATTVDDIVPRLERVAEILGLQDRAARLSKAIDKNLADIRNDESLADVRVAFLYVRGPAGVYLIGGPGSGPD